MGGGLILFNIISVDRFFKGKNNEHDWNRCDDEFKDFVVEPSDTADL
jgi:hypothetical protein